MNVGKDFATQVGGKIQPTSRIATVHDSQHTIVDNAGTGCSSYIVSDTPHVFNIRPIARDSVGHSANPQQLLQQDLWIGLRKDTGLLLTTGVETIKDTDDNPTDYHATISLVHRYYVAFFFVNIHHIYIPLYINVWSCIKSLTILYASITNILVSKIIVS
jgi:hypothetical protein